MDAGCGTKDRHGTFEFDLANLSYKVSLAVLKFIRRQARPLIRKEEQRVRLQAKRAAKAEQKSARASKKAMASLAEAEQPAPHQLQNPDIEQRLTALKEQESQLIPQLSQAPIA